MSIQAALLSALTLLPIASPAIVQAGGQAGGQPGEWSTEFDRPGLVGRVFGLGHWGGSLYAAGEGLQGDGSYLGSLARWDGSHWNPVLGVGPYGTVRALATCGGDLIVAGDFQGMGGISAANIARFDGQGWSPLGSGLGAEVFALAVYQGQLYAGGLFSTAGGQPARGVARWDGSGWQALGSGLQGTFGDEAYALLSAPDGRLYVGGSFDQAGGVATKSVAAWDGTSWSGLSGGVGTGVASRVHALEWFAGTLHLGGAFDLPGGANVARYDGAQFTALGGGIPDWSISTTVYSLRSFGADLYVGGNFDAAGPVSSRAVARWSGSQWSGVGGVDGSDLATTALAMVLHGGELVVGGEFTRAGTNLSAGQAVVSNSVAAFDGSSWSPMGQGLGFDKEVRDAVRWRGGLAAVGRFLEAGGSLTSQVAVFDGQDWSYVGLINGNVNAVIEFQGDLVVTGEFTQISGQGFNGIARWDGSGWSALGSGAGGYSLAVHDGELYAGGFGGARRWTGSTWQSLTGPQPSLVLAMHSHGDGKLYIGGSTSGPGPRLYAYDGSATAPVSSGVNDMVECLASYQGDLLIGGRFTQAGGAPANILARWDGVTLSPFGGLTGSLVKSLAVFQGELYAGGDLIQWSGNPADWIARWNGSSWDPLGQGLNGTPFCLVPDEGSQTLYAGGLFTKADDPGGFGEGVPSFYFAGWSTAPPSVGTSYCQALPNSTGSPALIEAQGSAQVAAANLELRTAGAVAGQAGIYFHGPQQAQLPWGDGFLCVGGTLSRSPVVAIDPQGQAVLGVAFSSPWVQALQPGDTANFQFWYRDPFAGGAGTNSSDGLQITFR